MSGPRKRSVNGDRSSRLAHTEANTTGPSDPRVEDLERRIRDLEARDELDFGRFVAWDWVVCVGFAVVVPLLFIWRCAG